MKIHEEVEATLQRLGNAWPENDSLVERVLQGLETAQPVIATQPVPSRWVRRIAACATVMAAAVGFVGWLFRPDDSLYGQARNAVERANTFQMIATPPAQGEPPPQFLKGAWYERGIGFREETATEVVIVNSQGTWRHLKGARMVVKSRANSFSEIVDRILGDNRVGRLLKDDKSFKYERFAAGDRDVNGQSCQAYLLTPTAPLQPESRDANRRLIYLVDDHSRIVRGINEVRSGEAWTEQSFHDLKYNEPIDRAMFEPRFDDVRVVDIDNVFEEFADLKKAIHREERQGIIFAVHHVERFENGGIFLISSVRGTDATLQKYPLKREHWNGGERVTGPAENYYIQPPHLNGFEVELASMKHEGIHVIWRAYFPRVPDDLAVPNPFEIRDGKVKLPAGFRPEGAFGKANFTDDRGVTHPLMWDVVLNVPEPAAMPTFQAIAERVYVDFTALDAVLFKFLNMGHRGLMANSLSDLSKISAQDYVSAVTDDVRWWKRPGTPVPRKE